jgi:hypothetical protein
MTSARHIALALGKARRLDASRYLCSCPVPEHGKGRGDRDPSLLISDGNTQQILVHCYAGCHPSHILDELRRRGLLLDNVAAVTANTKPAADRRASASYMWAQSRPIIGTIAEIYLREARGIACELPPSLRFLPAHKEYPPAMIAAFGLTLDRVISVHLTRLKSDGSSKIEDSETMPPKLMVGPVSSQPIVLAEPNDLLGLAIAEGIEDALTVHQSTGLGAWAAGSANHMPKLAAAVPDYIEAVTIYADPDKAGQDGASQLAMALRQREPRPGERPIEVEVEGL